MLLPLLALTFITWLAYWDAIRCGFVSDDIEGLEHYDGKLKKLDYGHLNKWLLYKLLGKDSKRNHIFSIILQNTNVILLYSFLSTIMPMKIAFMASILFAIHPICIQSISWISGRGYPISLAFILMLFNLISLNSVWGITSMNSLWAIPFLFVYAALYYLAVNAQFAALATFALNIYFGDYFLAAIGLGITGVLALGIIKEVVIVRTKTFEEQNLTASTKLHFRKVIVMLKTLYYFTKLCFFPKRLGLYHTFGYHYTEELEKDNKYSWAGFLIFVASVIAFIKCGPIVQFGILWYYAYVIVFSNFITIHQFVTERYLYIPSVGVCVLVAYWLRDFPIAFAFLCGIALMRTWAHQTTYEDEIHFYQSNIWNFPYSEVAFANLGVVYMRHGLVGSAADMWNISININKDYDVGYYNLAATLKQRGDLFKAKEYLEKAVNAKLCHFPKPWKEELDQLTHEIEYAETLNKMRQKVDILKRDENKRQEASNLEIQLNIVNNIHVEIDKRKKQELQLIEQDLSSLQARMVNLQNKKEIIAKPMELPDLVKTRDANFKIVIDAIDKLEKGGASDTTGNGISPSGQQGGTAPA